MMIVIIGLVIEMACIVAVANHLNKKIDMLDEAVYQYMKEEHNARAEDYIPRDYYEKVVSEMAKRNVEAADIVRCKECIYSEERIGRYMCHKLDEDWEIRFEADHFCSYGERSE